jgi:uncharacterized protein DUF6599
MAPLQRRLLNKPGTNGSLVVSKRKQGMRRYCLFLSGFALLGAAPAYAQKTILPKQFSGWALKSCTDKPVHFAFAKEAGEREFESCGYGSRDKSIGISLGLYRDPTSAYEVFTSRLRAGMMPTKLGQVAAFDKDGVLFQEGSLVGESSANISREDLAALIQSVEAKIEKTPLPPIRTYLPAEGRLVGSERYALGREALKTALMEAGQPEMPALVDAIGFGKAADAEAMLARYSSQGKGSGVLLLLEYPTPNVAEQHIHHLAEVLPTEANRGEENILRKGSLLSIVLSATSPEFAKSLREASNYETQVTWNEPSQTLTDPPITSIMVKIFIGTGVFMVAAIVLGIAFGGVRIITKRLFPGKVFDRPAQMEVLQLGLSSKPIDPTDLY